MKLTFTYIVRWEQTSVAFGRQSRPQRYLSKANSNTLRIVKQGWQRIAKACKPLIYNENMNIGIIGHCDPRIHTCIENHIPRGLLIVDVVKEQQKALEKEVLKIENFHIEKYIEPFFDAHKKKPKNEDWQRRIKNLQRKN